MQIDRLQIPDAFVVTPRQFSDDRGVFLEWFKSETFERETGHRLSLAQANCSVSRRGVVRGVHFAAVPPGQAKYVTCFSGSVLDVIVDIRVGSPTFGAVERVVLDTTDRRGVYLAEGLGHAFVALSDEVTVAYLCSTPYNPEREFGINPMDPALGIEWPAGLDPVLSGKDAAAPSLAEAQEQGLLPTYEDCQRWYAQRSAGPAPA